VTFIYEILALEVAGARKLPRRGYSIVNFITPRRQRLQRRQISPTAARCCRIINSL